MRPAALLLAALALLGCDGNRPAVDTGEAGILRFDAAMLARDDGDMRSTKLLDQAPRPSSLTKLSTAHRAARRA